MALASQAPVAAPACGGVAIGGTSASSGCACRAQQLQPQPSPSLVASWQGLGSSEAEGGVEAGARLGVRKAEPAPVPLRQSAQLLSLLLVLPAQTPPGATFGTPCCWAGARASVCTKVREARGVRVLQPRQLRAGAGYAAHHDDPADSAAVLLVVMRVCPRSV
jgi:hypothetical protein